MHFFPLKSVLVPPLACSFQLTRCLFSQVFSYSFCLFLSSSTQESSDSSIVFYMHVYIHILLKVETTSLKQNNWCFSWLRNPPTPCSTIALARLRNCRTRSWSCTWRWVVEFFRVLHTSSSCLFSLVQVISWSRLKANQPKKICYSSY